MTTSCKLTAAEELAALRFAVLLGLEQSSMIDSSGLSEAGQKDLQFLFARTSKLAALSHARIVGMGLFDERVRDRGFYHICRLPIYWENQMHAAYKGDALSQILGSAVPLDIIQEGFGIDPSAADAKEGAVNLKPLDLTEATSRRTLASIHANAMKAEKLVIPFFELA